MPSRVGTERNTMGKSLVYPQKKKWFTEVEGGNEKHEAGV